MWLNFEALGPTLYEWNVIIFLLFYIDLDLHNQKMLCLPSIYQFERTGTNLNHPRLHPVNPRKHLHCIEINIWIRLFSLNEPTVHNTPCIVLGLKEKSSTSKKSWLVSSVVFYNDRTLKLRRETFEKRIRKTARLLWQNNVFFLSLCFSIGVIVWMWVGF